MTRASSARRQRRLNGDASWAWVRERISAGAMREFSAAEYADLLSVGRGVVIHAMMFHDDACGIYDGTACSCQPSVRYFTDTNA